MNCIYELKNTDLWCKYQTAGQNTGQNTDNNAILCKVMANIMVKNGIIGNDVTCQVHAYAVDLLTFARF